MGRITKALARRWRGWWFRLKLLTKRSRIAFSTVVMMDKGALCEFGRDSAVRENGNIYIEADSTWRLGDNVRIMQGCEIEVIRGGKLEIGSNVYIGSYCNIRCAGRIRIADGVRLSQFVSVIDANYDFHKKDDPMSTLVPGEVTIGEGAWIGAQAVVLPRVEVAQGAVVGAAGVVTRDVPSFTIVAGNPARIIGRRE